MLKRYRYRAYPSSGQRDSLARLFGCVRVVFNDVIAARNQARSEGLGFVSSQELQRRLITEAKHTERRGWLAEVAHVPLQQSVQDAETAYRNFFNSLKGKRRKKVGAPRFKKRSHRQSARFSRSTKFRVHQTTHGVGKVRLSKVGWIRFSLSRELPTVPSSVTVIQEADGRYYVSFVVDVGPKAGHGERTSGVDLGLMELGAVVSSDGYRHTIKNPRFLRSRQRKLARAQKALSRTQKGSNNRSKARIRVAIEYRRVRDARADYHHKVARRLVDENQVIAVEDLNVAALGKTRMARSIYDAGWAQLVRLITDKATEAGATVVRADRWAPTSQVCAICGTKDGPKPLRIRVWQCAECRAWLDRDYNAAVNIMVAAGLAETLNACGGSIRPQLAGADPTNQEPTEGNPHARTVNLPDTVWA